MDETTIPHLAYPFRLNSKGTAAVVNDQGDDGDVLDQVEVLVSTEVGERIELPDFGIEDQTFREGGADVDEILGAIADWVPSADVDPEQEDPEDEALVDTVRLRVMGRTDNA